MTTLVACSHHLGLMWVAIEATTLATAPLIYFNRTPRSLEATWKYLLIGSVGIALALLGSFFLAYASLQAGCEPSLLFERPARSARRSCPGPGCTRRSCCCSSATARRWAWRRCTPGSPTPTARRPGVVGALLAGGADELRLPRAPARLPDLPRRRRRRASPRGCCSFIGLLSMAVAGRVHGRPARLQADARLLERRAHGHPGARASASAAPASSARCCTW